MPNKKTTKKGGHKKHSRIRTFRKDGPVSKTKKTTTKKSRGSQKNTGNNKGKAAHGKRKPRQARSSMRMRQPKHRQVTYTSSKKNNTKPLPDPGDNIRIIPLGGVEEVGKNMTIIEYKDDIIIVDAGLQFGEIETPGIDYIIPDISYLEERKDKIRGIFITHGHLDHIGAIPYITERLGNPTVYTREFGAVMMQKRHEEFPQLAKLNIRGLEGNETITLDNLKLQFFVVDHSIPDAMGIIIETPFGDIVTTGDVKIDHVDGDPVPREKEIYSIFKDRNVLMLMLDSTNIENPGWSMAEPKVIENVDKIMKDTKGRLIVAMFASNIDRMIGFMELAEKYNRKVIIEGRSIKTNIEMARKMGLVKTKHIIPLSEMEEHPPHKIMMLVTGAQGEEFAALMRIANNTHRTIKLNPTDTVMLSSSIIPGNEDAITKLKDNLYRHEAHIITYRSSEIHASGHGNKEELKWIHNQIPYKFFMPIHGHHYMTRIHADMAHYELGVPKENIVVPDNGSIIEITPNGEKIKMLKEKAMAGVVMVDGFSVSGMQEVVIRDRQHLAEDGIFVIVASINPRDGKLRKSPDIIARGFVYLRESQQLLDETRAIIKRTVEGTTKGMHPINFDLVKNAVTEEVRKHLFQKTAKSPMVIPVIIGV